MITWIVAEVIAAVAEVFLIREAYHHRPSLVGQPQRFRAWLLLSVGVAILLITGAIYIWKNSAGSIS